MSVQRDIACGRWLIFIASFSLLLSSLFADLWLDPRNRPPPPPPSIRFGADFRSSPIGLRLWFTRVARRARTDEGQRLVGAIVSSQVTFDREIGKKGRWTTTKHRSTRLVSPVSRMVSVLRAVNVGVVLTGKRGRERERERGREKEVPVAFTRAPASGHRERERDNRVWM